jgi:hypothetical protein
MENVPRHHSERTKDTGVAMFVLVPSIHQNSVHERAHLCSFCVMGLSNAFDVYSHGQVGRVSVKTHSKLDDSRRPCFCSSSISVPLKCESSLPRGWISGNARFASSPPPKTMHFKPRGFGSRCSWREQEATKSENWHSSFCNVLVRNAQRTIHP